VLSYQDVIYGRLLLHEGAISLSDLWEALRDIARLEREGARPQTLAEVLAQGRLGTLAGVQSLEQARNNLNTVLRVEQDRTLARLLHNEAVLSEQQIRQAYARSRAGGFKAGLIGVLRAEGLVTAAQARRALERVEVQLQHGRASRAEALQSLVRTLGPVYSLSEAARLRPVFELASGAESRPQPRPPTGRPATGRPAPGPVPGPPPGPPPKPKGQAATPPQAPETWKHQRQPPPGTYQIGPARAPEPSRQGTDKHAPLAEASDEELRPEDCPIYGYEIERELGKGSMGVVYKARHVISERITALKVLPLRLAAKTQYLERFKREAMALMRIEHPNVVRGYDFGGSEDYYYLALEFVEGEPLDKLLLRRGALPEREALGITRQVALGLGAASEHGVVHRDIKPENVMLTPEGVAKICDFGIVKLADLSEQSVTMAGTTVGTPFYISPEQAKGEDDLDVRTDIYSLGISLFHLVTGRVPFTGKSQGAILVRHILEDVPDPRSLRPDLSQALADIVKRMTAKKPEDRYPSPAELVEDLDAALA